MVLRTGMETMLITHHKFRAQYVIRQRIITGQQRQQRRGVGAQQTIGFIVQQQVADARFSTAIGCSVCHRNSDHKAAFFNNLRQTPGRTAYRTSAAQIASALLVQPDALPQIHRTIVNRFCDERRINRSRLLQTRRI